MILFHSLLRFRFLEAMDVASVERNATLTDHMSVFDFCYERNSVMLRSGVPVNIDFTCGRQVFALS